MIIFFLCCFWTRYYRYIFCWKHYKATYLAMAVLKVWVLAAGRYTAFPSASTPEISLREHSVVRRTKLQVWGTSTSTCAAKHLSIIQGHKTILFMGKISAEKTYFAGDFGSALVVRRASHTVKVLSFVVIHKSPEVLESFGHWKMKKSNSR